jgi:hypothetical protein
MTKAVVFMFGFQFIIFLSLVSSGLQWLEKYLFSFFSESVYETDWLQLYAQLFGFAIGFQNLGSIKLTLQATKACLINEASLRRKPILCSRRV